MGIRERFQRHREDRLCASCHSIIDPLGFALENLVEAIYRIVPARAGSDVETLAMRAKAKAESTARAATR